VSWAEGAVEPGRASTPSRRGVLSLLDSTIAKAGAVATSLSAIAGVGWGVWHYAFPPPPARLAATIEQVESGFYPDISFRQFLELERPEAQGDISAYSAKQLKCRVAYLQLRVTVEGYSGKTVWLRWMLSDAGGADGVGRPLTQEVQQLSVEGPYDSGLASMHVLLPPKKKMSFRAQLFRKVDERFVTFSEPYVSPTFRGHVGRQNPDCPV
jgi:hypothetical protein